MKSKSTLEMLNLPDFIIIGAEKAATTSMHYVLSNHPDVQMASNKEVGFFCVEARYQKGLSFYSSHFDCIDNKKMLGEATPSYLYCEKTPARIAAALPRVKLIASLRNPVHRAFSAWQMRVLKGSETRQFSRAIQEDSSYTERGRYYYHLSRYLDLFPKEQILMLLFDDLKQPDDFYSLLFDFIGVDMEKIDSRLFTEIPNKGGAAKWAAVPLFLNAVYRARGAIRKTPFRDLVDNYWIGRYGRGLFIKVAIRNRKPATQRPKFDVETANYIIDSLSDDINKLSNLIGRDLSHWKAIN